MGLDSDGADEFVTDSDSDGEVGRRAAAPHQLYSCSSDFPLGLQLSAVNHSQVERPAAAAQSDPEPEPEPEPELESELAPAPAPAVPEPAPADSPRPSRTSSKAKKHPGAGMFSCCAAAPAQ